MTDEMDIEDFNPPEIVSNDNNLPACEPLLSRLEPFKTLSVTTRASKKQAWSQFLSLWCEVLQMSPSDIPSCYKECARLILIVFKATDFYTSRKDISVARENCFLCITQLNQPRIKNYLLLTKEQQELPENQIYYKHVFYLLYIAAQTASFLPFATVEDQQFIANHKELFILFIERVDRNMPEHSPTIIEKDHPLESINDRILSFFWNVSDRTVLIPILLECDLAKRMIHWISQAAMLTKTSRRPFISIIHNIARHDDGADELNKNDAINVIKQYRDIKIEKVESQFLLISMALALLSTPEQLKSDKKGMNSVLNQLLQLVIDAAKGDRYRRDGIHVSEPLGVLVKMFVVEERTLDYVLCHAETEPPSDMVSTIHLFISLFIHFSEALKGTDRLEQFTLIALLNILWSISFQPNYGQELIKNEIFIEKIKRFTEDNNGEEILEQYKPRSMENFKEAAHGILLNLNIDSNKNDVMIDEQKNVIDALVSTLEENQKPWIMISYCHANNEFCDEIISLLDTRSDAFEIWIDRTHCDGVIDLWETIAEGMERACVIICLLSSQYFESKSCRQEFIYAADSLKRRIVPVLIESFEPKGWLGIRMTGMKYIRFRDVHQLEKNKMSELLNTILSSLSPSKTMTQENLLPSQHRTELPPVRNGRKSTSAPPDTFEQRISSDNDIHAWFAHHRISTQLRDLFDFQTKEEILDYAQLLTKDREKQMDIYARIFIKKYHGNDMPPHEFSRFANAAEQLLKDNRPSSTIIKPNSPTVIKSSTCSIL